MSGNGLTKEYFDERIDEVKSLIQNNRDEEIQRISVVESDVKWLKGGFWSLCLCVLGLFGIKL